VRNAGGGGPLRRQLDRPARHGDLAVAGEHDAPRAGRPAVASEADCDYGVSR